MVITVGEIRRRHTALRLNTLYILQDNESRITFTTIVSYTKRTRESPRQDLRTVIYVRNKTGVNVEEFIRLTMDRELLKGPATLRLSREEDYSL